MKIEKDRSLTGMHVLIVEDNEDSRTILGNVLEHAGAIVTTASSARRALALLDQFKPDVIVSDIAMPDEDGYWLIQQIRNLSPDKGGTVRALALSAYGGDQRRKALAAGFHGFLPKPVNLRDFCDVVAELCGARAR